METKGERLLKQSFLPAVCLITVLCNFYILIWNMKIGARRMRVLKIIKINMFNARLSSFHKQTNLQDTERASTCQ